MSLLSYDLKAFNRYFLLVCCFFLTAVNASAQDSIPDPDFEKARKAAAAYYTHAYRDVTYFSSWQGIRRFVTMSNKLVVNTSAGVDDYAFLNLDEYTVKHLEEIEVKTLKADGTVIELDSSLVFQRNGKSKSVEAISYPIPGVEPGDTIYASYTFADYIKSAEALDYVNLYSELPNYDAQYSVRTHPSYTIKYKGYNDFPDPQVIVNDSVLYCVFKMEKLPGKEEHANSCIPCELPYVYYTMEKKESELRSWKDVYNEEFNFLTQPMSIDMERASYYRRWKKRVLGAAKDSSKYVQFRLLHENLVQRITMEEMGASTVKELIKSSGYFLKEQRFNPLSIKRLYRQLLEDLEIPYSAVFAKSKNSGPIDFYYIRKGEFDHVFFAYENEQGSIDLLYPHEAHHKYQINELPTSLYNTEAVAVEPWYDEKIRKKDKFIGRDLQLNTVDSVKVKTMLLPGMSPSQNKVNQLFFSRVERGKDNTKFDFRFRISGGLSTELRNFFGLMEKNKEMEEYYDAVNEYEGSSTSFEVDSILTMNFNTRRPFVYNLTGKATAKEVVTALNDSTYSITLEHLIDHHKIGSEHSKTDLDYHLDYSFSDEFIMLLEFPAEIELVGGGDPGMNYANDYGTYYFDVNIMGNKLKIMSTYQIKEDHIPKEDDAQLKELNEKAVMATGRRFLFRLKEGKEQAPESTAGVKAAQGDKSSREQ